MQNCNESIWNILFGSLLPYQLSLIELFFALRGENKDFQLLSAETLDTKFLQKTEDKQNEKVSGEESVILLDDVSIHSHFQIVKAFFWFK